MPPGGTPGTPLGSGLSATIPSVVINSPTTEGRILQCHAHDLARIQNPGRHHVLVVSRLRLIASVPRLLI
jgi:hypothetical protein